MSVALKKCRRSLHISIEETGKTHLEPGQEIMGYAPVLSRCLLRNTSPKPPVCWSIVVMEKPAVGSPFFAAFPSDRISAAT